MDEITNADIERSQEQWADISDNMAEFTEVRTQITGRYHLFGPKLPGPRLQSRDRRFPAYVIPRIDHKTYFFHSCSRGNY